MDITLIAKILNKTPICNLLTLSSYSSYLYSIKRLHTILLNYRIMR